MDNKKMLRKIIMFSCGTVFTAATLVTSTYAWFARNGDAVFDETILNLETGSGLEVSLDGVNFTQDITLDMLKEVILQNTGVEYGSQQFKPVTMKMENGKVQYDENGHPLFEKDSLINNPDYTAEKPDEVYTHKMVDAEKSDYLYFDVYFKLSSNGQRSGNWNLSFQDTRTDNGVKTGISGLDTLVTLSNSLYTSGSSYSANQTIKVNPANAMRIAAVNQTTKKLTVYEDNIGMGSTAIEGLTDPYHNKVRNAMYTYYNNKNPRAKFTKAAENGEAFENTVSRAYYAKNYAPKDTVVEKNTSYYYDSNGVTYSKYFFKDDVIEEDNKYYTRSLETIDSNRTVYSLTPIHTFEEKYGYVENSVIAGGAVKDYTYYEKYDEYKKLASDAVYSKDTVYYTLTSVEGTNTYNVAAIDENSFALHKDSLYTKIENYTLTTDKTFVKDKTYYVYTTLPYENVKMTFAIWLEGWDADYISGIETDKIYDPLAMSVNMSFKVSSVDEN